MGNVTPFLTRGFAQILPGWTQLNQINRELNPKRLSNQWWTIFLTQNWMILTLNRFIARVYEKKIIKRDSWKTTFIFWLTWTLRETVDNFIWRTISWNALFSLLAVSVTPTEPQSTSQREAAISLTQPWELWLTLAHMVNVTNIATILYCIALTNCYIAKLLHCCIGTSLHSPEQSSLVWYAGNKRQVSSLLE